MIKKIIIIAVSLTMFLFNSISVFALDYIYNGIAGKHSFSFKFPSNWYARTMGEKKQGFSPNLTNEELSFEVLEFEGQSLKQVSSYFENDEIEFLEFKDEFLYSPNEDLIVKKAIYAEKDSQKKFAKTLIKRGNIILAVSTPNLDATLYPYDKATNEVIKRIFSSFSFTDNWKQYIDFENKLSFSFPKKFFLESENIAGGKKTTLKDPVGKTIFFSSFIFPKKSILDAMDLIKIPNERLDSKYEEPFHGIENTIKALFVNLSNGKKQSFFIIGKNGNAYAFEGENTETNYPRTNYHNDYVKEILQGIEFFDIEGDYFPYLIFKDVRANHPNEQAINLLANQKIIQGYADGSFGPDKEISRAELSKMLIESIKPGIIDSSYKNCFPDVKEEWFAKYICYAKEKNWIAGYKDGKFKPQNNINRAEALKIIYEVLIDSSIEQFSETLKDTKVLDVNESAWYFKYFVYFQNRELLDLNHIEINDDKTYDFEPDANITRKEVAETISRMKIF